MSSLTVWKFDSPEGAQQALEKLQSLSQQNLIVLHDAAVVSWPAGRKHPKTQNYGSMTGQGALSGAFWGMLFGLIFLVPFFGLAIGAAMGAISGRFVDYGINDQFIKSVRDRVTEGTSALFLLSSGAVRDRIAEAFAGQHGELIESNLSAEQEAMLRTDFASPMEESSEAAPAADESVSDAPAA